MDNIDFAWVQITAIGSLWLVCSYVAIVTFNDIRRSKRWVEAACEDMRHAIDQGFEQDYFGRRRYPYALYALGRIGIPEVAEKGL